MNEQHVSSERLIDYLHGELSPGEDAGVHAHLAGCAECREAYDSETRLSEVLRAHARAEERDLPQGVVASIRAAIDEPQPSWWARLTGPLRPFAVGTAIAAGILVGTFFSLRGWHSHAQASTIDAAYYLDDHASLTNTTPFGETDAAPATLTEGATESEEQPAGDATH